MHFDGGRVQFHGLDLDAQDLLSLQLFKDVIQHAILGPAIHARVDGVPVTKALRQAAPLAALLGDVQQRVEHLQVRDAYIAALARQTGCDTKVLCFGEFHKPKHTTKTYLVLTRPRSFLQIV